MAIASSKAVPSTSDFFTRSEPARSTRCSLPRKRRDPDFVITSTSSTYASDDASFIAVAEVTRLALALAMVAICLLDVVSDA